MTTAELRRELQWAREQAKDAAFDGDVDALAYHAAEVRELTARLAKATHQ